MLQYVEADLFHYGTNFMYVKNNPVHFGVYYNPYHSHLILTNINFLFFYHGKRTQEIVM